MQIFELTLSTRKAVTLDTTIIIDGKNDTMTRINSTKASINGCIPDACTLPYSFIMFSSAVLTKAAINLCSPFSMAEKMRSTLIYPCKTNRYMPNDAATVATNAPAILHIRETAGSWR